MRDLSRSRAPNLLTFLGLSMNNNHCPFPRVLPTATAALGAALTLALLAGCAGFPKPFGPQAYAVTPPVETKVAAEPVPAPLPDPEPAKKTPLFEWTGKGRAVTRIVVDVDQQKARFYEGDNEVGWTMVASGVSKFPTPVGRFSVTEKVANKESNLYGKVYGKGGQLISSNAKMGKTAIPAGARFDGADMPYYMRLTGDGIGMHAGPIPNPGRPASHGCIRMPKAFAPIAFRHVGVGTEVSIVGKGPTYSAYLAQQRTQSPRPVVAAKPAAPKVEGEGQAAAGTTQGPAATAVAGSESAAGGAAVVAAAAAQGTTEAATQVADSSAAAPAAAQPAALTTPAVVQAPAAAPQAPTASANVAVTPQATPAKAPAAPVAAAPVAPVPAAPVEVAKVPAVAHTSAPLVAPAIATRVEPAQAAPAPVQPPAAVVAAPSPAPAPAPVQVAAKPEAPAVASKADPAAAAPAPVFKPVPQVPEFRAPAPAAAPALAPTPAPAAADSAPKAAG